MSAQAYPSLDSFPTEKYSPMPSYFIPYEYSLNWMPKESWTRSFWA